MWGWLASGSTSLQEQVQPSLKRGNSPYKSPGTEEPSKNNLSSEAKRVLTKRLFDDSVDHTATPVEAPPSIPHDVSPDDEQQTIDCTVSACPIPATVNAPPLGTVDTEGSNGGFDVPLASFQDDRPTMWGWLAPSTTALQEQAQPSLKRGNSPYKSPGTEEPSKTNLSSEAKRVLTKRLFNDSVDHTATPMEALPSIPHDVSPDDEQHTTVSAGPTPASADGPPFGAVDTEDLDGDIEYTDGDIFLSIAKSAENNVCVANLLSSHDPSSLSSLGILQGLSDLGFSGFRSPYQEAAVISVTEGIKATSVRLPTGGGKSLTFYSSMR
jgi:hypothetical protein